MLVVTTLFLLCALFLIPTSVQSVDIPNWIKDQAEKIPIQNIDDHDVMSVLENLSSIGMIKNIIHDESNVYQIPSKGETVFVNISGNVNEYGKSGFVLLEIHKPDNTKETIRALILETGFYSTVFPINYQSQKGTYQVISEFNNKQISVDYFSLTTSNDVSEIPSWFVTVFHWWVEHSISDAEFIQCAQYLVNDKILTLNVNNQNISELEVIVDGQHLVRRGVTHTITSHVTLGDKPVEGARVTLTVEDYGENIIRESSGFTNADGLFIFSWEIPKKYDDIETLLAYIDVTYDNSSVTKLFKFQVYCLPGEFNCKIKGN
ncbi:MAG TPA: hypothetical protein VLD64_02015 [Nitrosarchaeum sp.]|nr:hypothetical protein [Nitrosarchaeum sp.]